MNFKKCKLFVLQKCKISIDTSYYKYVVSKYDTFCIQTIDNTVIMIAPRLYKTVINKLKPISSFELTDNDEISFDFSNIETENIFLEMKKCAFGYFDSNDLHRLNESSQTDKRFYYLNSAMCDYLKTVKSKHSKIKTLDKTYHFLLHFDTCNPLWFGELKYHYPEAYKCLSDRSGLYLMITTNNKQFLKKCISRFEPLKTTIVKNEDYKNIIIKYNLTKTVI